MLNVLSFKKSVFAGVLDGGENEVFLGGTKLKKFMETVEEVSGKIPDPMPAQEPGVNGGPGDVAEDLAAAETAFEPAAREEPVSQPWEELFKQGVSLFGKLAQALQPPTETTARRSQSGERLSPAAFIAKDEKTGESFLKLPVPSAETLQGIASLVGALANALQKR